MPMVAQACIHTRIQAPQALVMHPVVLSRLPQPSPSSRSSLPVDRLPCTGNQRPLTIAQVWCRSLANLCLAVHAPVLVSCVSSSAACSIHPYLVAVPWTDLTAFPSNALGYLTKFFSPFTGLPSFSSPTALSIVDLSSIPKLIRVYSLPYTNILVPCLYLKPRYLPLCCLHPRRRSRA